eukprot:3286933-Amphidinium_carterae.1
MEIIAHRPTLRIAEVRTECLVVGKVEDHGGLLCAEVWREELEQMCGWLQTEQRALSGHITDVHSTADAYLHSAKLELED